MPEQKMSYQERKEKVDNMLSAKSNYEDVVLCIAAQAEAIREYAIKYLRRTPSAVEDYLRQHGYIQPRTEEDGI